MEQRKGYTYYSTQIKKECKPEDLRETVLWLFWRKVLKLRRYRFIDRIVETFEVKEKLKARVIYRFVKDRTREVLTISISRHEPIYFTVVKGSNVFESEHCLNMREFERAFMKYFLKKTPILPPTAGVFT